MGGAMLILTGVSCALYLCHLVSSSQRPHEEGTGSIPIIQMGKRRSEIKCLAQGCQTCKCQPQDSNNRLPQSASFEGSA